MKEIIPTKLCTLWNDSENDEFDKLRAAYALNMCTVSVSQIIKSRDQYVMDQEYNTILNNLNLENMPNEKSLLEILKQILDVITFFKIQEEDKKFIEEDYRQALKQNLTKSVNIAGLIGSVSSIGISDLTKPGTWIKTGLSIASTVGIGYMNYRSGKTQAALEKRKKEWELQRTAIEQLNGLRRELLDTAWNITKSTGIKDEYRLTENQIEEYLEILNDSDDYRRFERLDFIKGKFLAYPPFWYQLGHTAKLISDAEEDYKKQYINYAKVCFKFFDNLTEKNLLRDDQIASSCALEYAELFNPEIEDEKVEIKRLLDKAMLYSGNSNDVLQLCAMGYLRIGEVKTASRILWRLVNESYEENFNSEILSLIYYNTYLNILINNSDKEVKELVLINDENEEDSAGIMLSDGVFSDTKESIEYAYDLLTTRVSEDAYLIPLPEDGSAITLNDYIGKRKKLIQLKIRDVVGQIYSKYCQEFVQTILPRELVSYDDYPIESSDICNWIESSFNIIQRGNQITRWNELIKEESFCYKVYRISNELFKCLFRFSNNSIEFKQEIEDSIYEYFSKTLNTYNSIETCEDKNRLDFVKKNKSLFINSELIEGIDPIVQAYCINNIDSIRTIDEIGDIERQLYVFVKEYDLVIPVIPYIEEERASKKSLEKQNELDPKVFGIDDIYMHEENRKIERERVEAIISIINKKKDEILRNNSEHYSIKVTGDSNYNKFISGMTELNGKSPIFILYKKNSKDKIIGKRTLAFTAEGIYWIEKGISVPYSGVLYGKRNVLLLGTKQYSSDDLDMDALGDAIDSIASIVDKNKEFDARKFINEADVERKLNRIVKTYTTVATINGVNPIPMVNVAPQIAIQVSMLYSIANTYKLNLKKDDLKELAIEVIKRASENAGEQQLFKTIALLIPGGIVVGGVISASVTGALTYAMGKSFIDYCRELVHNNQNDLNRDNWVEEAAQKMVKPFSAEIVKKEVELGQQVESDTKDYSVEVEDLKMEFVRMGKAIESSMQTLQSVSNEMENSNQIVQEGLKGWDNINDWPTD